MNYIALSRYSAHDVHVNLALEEILLNHVASNTIPPLIRIWNNPESVILGISRSISKDLFINNITQDNIALARRISGGGTVYHDSGTLSISFFYPWKLLGFDDDPRQVDSRSIKPFLNTMIDILQTFGLTAYHQGISDIFSNGKKISGNAQKRVRKAILHHGTILIKTNLYKMNRYLKIPPERNDISHDDFVTSLDELGLKIDEKDFFHAVQVYLNKIENLKVHEIDIESQMSHMINKAQDLAESSYKQRNWIFRKP